MIENVKQHFRNDEQIFVEMCHDWVRNVEHRYVPYLTSFLNPRERYILKSVVGSRDDCKLSFYGGYDNAERQRALLYPPYFEVAIEDYELVLCEIKYAEKFTSLKHSQVLGSLLGSGITRETVGDIVTDGSRWQFFTEKQIATFLPSQMEKMGRVSVEVSEIPIDQKVEPIDEWITQNIVVASLRLDALIASVYNLSRQNAKDLVSGKKVKVNWTEETRAGFEIEAEDMVSVRKFGRFQLKTTNGYTRKDNLRADIRMLTRKK